MPVGAVGTAYLLRGLPTYPPPPKETTYLQLSQPTGKSLRQPKELHKPVFQNPQPLVFIYFLLCINFLSTS